MANDNGDRKELAKKLIATIIALVLILVAVFLWYYDVEISQIEEFLTTLFTTEVTTEATNHLTTVPIQNVEGQLVVHMIDVGQADCFLLIQDDKTALVDCGTRSTGKDAVEYIKELGITKIDYVIGTHPHDDHMGGMYDIITNFEIGTVIIPDSRNGDITANWYLKLMSELKTGSYKTHYAQEGDIFNLEEATMNVIAAETDVSGNTNNYSIVLKVTFGQMDMIMTGDAETEIEEKILESGVDIEAEILKVGHHGSDTSSSDEFLDAIDPDYGLISCKVGNKYEHPIKSTMEKLEKRNIEVYRTDECGSVIITITTDDVTFNSEPGDYLSGVEVEERDGK